MTDELLTQIVRTKSELKHLPIIANADFGHTFPLVTFPVGGIVRVEATKEQSIIEIVKH